MDEVHQFYRTPRGLQLLALLERLKRLARRHKRIAPEPLLATFEEFLPGLGEPEATEILKEMEAQHLLRPYHVGHGVYPLGREGHQWIDRRWFYTNFATPDERWASLVTPEEVLSALGWEMEGLKELFCCSRHLDSLPPDLQRAELLSSFEAGTLEALVALRERPIVPLV